MLTLRGARLSISSTVAYQRAEPGISFPIQPCVLVLPTPVYARAVCSGSSTTHGAPFVVVVVVVAAARRNPQAA